MAVRHHSAVRAILHAPNRRRPLVHVMASIVVQPDQARGARCSPTSPPSSRRRRRPSPAPGQMPRELGPALRRAGALRRRRRRRSPACARSTTRASSTCAARCRRSSAAAAPGGPRARALPVRARPHRHGRARRFAPQLRIRRRSRHLRDDADAARPFRELLPRAVPAPAREPRRLARGRHERAADPGPLLVRRARPHRGQPERRAAACSCATCSTCRTSARWTTASPTAPTSPRAGEARPLALFTAPRVDYSLHRLRHYTGTDPEHFQNFVLFTNYQFYIDEFVRLGHEAMAGGAGQRPTTTRSSSRAT